jgi:hypothetical protein
MKFLDRSWSDAMSWFYPGLCALHTVEENQYGEYIQSEESQLPQINLPPVLTAISLIHEIQRLLT